MLRLAVILACPAVKGYQLSREGCLKGGWFYSLSERAAHIHVHLGYTRLAPLLLPATCTHEVLNLAATNNKNLIITAIIMETAERSTRDFAPCGHGGVVEESLRFGGNKCVGQDQAVRVLDRCV